MMYTTIGTVITRWVMTSEVSVLLNPRNWNSVNSGIRKDSAGVMRAMRISTVSLRARARAMPYPAGMPTPSASSVADPDTTMLFQKYSPIEFSANTCTKLRSVGGLGMKTGGYARLSISFLRESDSIHRKTRMAGETMTTTDSQKPALRKVRRHDLRAVDREGRVSATSTGSSPAHAAAATRAQG